MSKQSIETFFAGKNLVVPSYQRDYAWKERNIDELFADVEEALEVGGHYLGTFILSQQSTSAPVFVVDGQQRLTLPATASKTPRSSRSTSTVWAICCCWKRA